MCVSSHWKKKKEQYLAKSVTGVFVGALYYPVPEKLAEEMGMLQ